MNRNSLFDRVIEWEEQNSLVSDDGEYIPYFDSARRIAKDLGYEPYSSGDGSSFGVLYTEGQIEQVLLLLSEKWL